MRTISAIISLVVLAASVSAKDDNTPQCKAYRRLANAAHGTYVAWKQFAVKAQPIRNFSASR